MGSDVKITFGIIVLNGEPFTRYCLRQIYPFAHEIIVVEGGSRHARDQAPLGHSTDGTLEALKDFKEKEDSEHKVRIVSRYGFWNEKDEQSQAYAVRATGDYLWQIDIDEFYRQEDLNTVAGLLQRDRSINGVGFHWRNFWGSWDYEIESWTTRRHWERWGGVRRVFKWGPGYSYRTHRPPTVVDHEGRNLHDTKWISGRETARLGIFCYHYGMVLEKQARQKVSYYQDMWESHRNMGEWFRESFTEMRFPFRILHGTEEPSWLRPFTGAHPEELQKLIREKGEAYRTGNTTRLAALCNATWYRVASRFLSVMYPCLARRGLGPLCRGIGNKLVRLRA